MGLFLKSTMSLGVIAAGSCFFVHNLVHAQTAAERPHVLMIAVDDLNCALGCYGDKIAQTQHLDRLAHEGICFQNAYNQIPLCNPSRVSLLTGLRPDRTEVFDLSRHFRQHRPETVTLPQAFQRAGYRTHRVGKVFHYAVPAAIGTDGLDDPPSWHGVTNPIGRDKTDEAQVVNAEPGRPISAALSWLAADGRDDEQTDGKIATEAIKLLESAGEQPLFLAVGFFRPHTPYVAPKSYFDLYPLETMRLPYAPPDDRDDIPVAAFAHNNPIPHYGLPPSVLLQATQAYYACVSFIDAQVGRLLEALDRLELSERTIVVFWSDHGYHLGEHLGIWQKRTLFEQAARAPLMIRAPGIAGRGNCRRVVEFVDIYPTLMELAGLDPIQGLDGTSLKPLLQQPNRDWADIAVTQILRPADDRLSEPVMGCSIRTARYRYTTWGNGKHGEELYDHQTDPSEFNNLAVDPDPAATRAINRLKSLLAERASGQLPSQAFDPQGL